ncbi:MAG: Hpt domain-containing protein [Velocimicrobium sp.]
MKMEKRKELKAVGINLESGLARFVGNESLFIDFLKKFPYDSTYSKVEEELNQNNSVAAYKAAHTLKGVAGNLSLDSLYQQMNPLVESLRKGKIEDAKSQFCFVKECYSEIVTVLNDL